MDSSVMKRTDQAHLKGSGSHLLVEIHKLTLESVVFK
jgi:hypothetical protein